MNTSMLENLMPPMFSPNGDLNAVFLLLAWVAIIVGVNLVCTVIFRDRKDDEMRNLGRRNKRFWAALITIPLPLVLLMLVCFVPVLIACLVLPRVALAVVGFFEALFAKEDDKATAA